MGGMHAEPCPIGRRQLCWLRSPITKATSWRVRRHMTVHSQRLLTRLRTKLQASSNSSTSSGRAGASVDMRGGKAAACSPIHRAMVRR